MKISGISPFGRPRRFALGTRPARCRRRILQIRENRNGFPSGGRLYCGQAGEYLSGTPLLTPKSCLPSATGLGTFGQSPKAAGTFRGPLPSFLRAASPYPSFRAKKPTRSPTGAVCRSCTTMPVSIRASPPGGKTGTVFPALSIRHRHLAGRVPRAKRLGRPKGEIPGRRRYQLRPKSASAI